MSGHTPTPWFRNISPATKYPVIFSGRNKHVAQVVMAGLSEDEVEANAAHIVKCVNAHPELVKALKDMLSMPNDTQTYGGWDELVRAMEERARAALSLAGDSHD